MLIQHVEQGGRREQETDPDGLEEETQSDDAEHGSDGEWSGDVEAQVVHGGRVWTSSSAGATLPGFRR